MLELVESARSARTHAHAPYSGYAVGAAVRLTSGDILTGANFENASYGLSLCAEAAVLAAANSAGHLAEVIEIAVVGGAIDDSESPIITPCGRCRQIIAEVQSVAGRAIGITCAQPKGAAWANYTLEELLPHAFAPAHLSRAKEDN